ncbi:dienelactone hydrolase family protein [Psychromarinibacter sp. C21-152]|uniref:Dienelactone hydrolase family protein n=1 Tax=Psychromarinibacter sediminicola TaxID=3033385 RepID=A0AAE3NXE3_9RHOB|nr:dienelactone hydrolase family protein [Psychromarinibacter sediminicola]MDF0602402.1 dienelactone hydrolase family protein [Psychromarinibacter sediminicola]
MTRLVSLAALILTLTAPAALAETVEYDVGGVAHTGYFAAAEDPQGLVLIVHDWDGLDDYETGRADMLAEMGYDAFALDMYGADTEAGTVDQNRAATGELYQDREKMRTLIEAGLAQAREMSEAEGLVVMGYCFGGSVTLEMARSDMAGEAAGYATFHGGLGTPEGQGYGADVPPILVMHGGADQAVPMSEVAALTNELEEAGATYTIEVYSGAPHAFTVKGSSRYQERADMESWEAFSDFLAETVGG